MRGAVIAVAACCTLLAHLAVETRSVPLTVACLALLVLLALGAGLARGSWVAWTLALVASAALALAASRPWVWLPLYAPSVIGDALAAWVFGHTLAPGRIPLVERMVRLVQGAPDGPIEPQIARYARSLTAAWTVLLGALGLASLALALCASPNGVLELLGFAPPFTVPQTAWSWYANVGEYAIVAAFFLVEYAYRRRRLPQQLPYAGFRDFVARLAAAAPRLLESGLWEPPSLASRRPPAASQEIAR